MAKTILIVEDNKLNMTLFNARWYNVTLIERADEMHTLIIKAEAGLMPGIDILPIGPGEIRQRFMKAASF